MIERQGLVVVLTSFIIYSKWRTRTRGFFALLISEPSDLLFYLILDVRRCHLAASFSLVVFGPFVWGPRSPWFLGLWLIPHPQALSDGAPPRSQCSDVRVIHPLKCRTRSSGTCAAPPASANNTTTLTPKLTARIIPQYLNAYCYANGFDRTGSD